MSAPRRQRIAAAGILALALAAAAMLKLHYSAASADELGWILAPTAALVELVTGADFAAEPGTGYLSTELRYLIAPSCAGINFLVVAFTALVIGFVRPHRRPAHNALVAAASAAAALAGTLVANTIRIALAIALHVHGVSWGWLTPDRLHRIAGVVVYLALLLGLFAAAGELAARGSDRVRAGVRVPIGAYLVVALLVPLANGGHARAAFWEHAAVVVTVLVGAGLVVAALRRANRSGYGQVGGRQGGDATPSCLAPRVGQRALSVGGVAQSRHCFARAGLRTMEGKWKHSWACPSRRPVGPRFCILRPQIATRRWSITPTIRSGRARARHRARRRPSTC